MEVLKGTDDELLKAVLSGKADMPLFLADYIDGEVGENKGGPGSGFHSGPNRHGRPGKVGGSSNSYIEVDKPVDESPKKLEPPPKFKDSVEGEEWLIKNFKDTKFYNIRSLSVEDVQDTATSLYEFEKYFPGAMKTLSMLRVSSKKSDGVEDMKSSSYATTEMWYKDTHLVSESLTYKPLKMLESMRKDYAVRGSIDCRITLNSACIVTGKLDRKSTRLNSSHRSLSRMPSSA